MTRVESVKPFDLDQFLSRVPQEDYSRLITGSRSHGDIDLAASASHYWDNVFAEGSRYQKKLQALQAQLVRPDGVVLDLGGGNGNIFNPRRLGVEPAGACVTVDLMSVPGDQKTAQGFKYVHGKDGNWRVQADMLQFLQFVPDQSVKVIVLNAIDNLVIADREKHKALADQMARVLEIGGIIMGANSDALRFFEGDDRFRILVGTPPLDIGKVVLERVR